ncbi:MAG: hypothetical protein L0G27_03555 [Paracoccus sp. (in: a-proteobacteria)]|nr:hypothetical protein [Paracoccus sp. (in: a-proteobacteria)]
MTRPHRMTDLATRPLCAITLIDRRKALAHAPAHLTLSIQGRHRARPTGQVGIPRDGGHAALPVIL